MSCLCIVVYLSPRGDKERQCFMDLLITILKVWSITKGDVIYRCVAFLSMWYAVEPSSPNMDMHDHQES